jgi:ankyrin repeat protein
MLAEGMSRPHIFVSLVRTFYTAAVTIALLGSARAQQPAIRLNPQEAHVADHLLGETTAFHLTADEYRAVMPGRNYFEFEITVSANGRVNNARVVEGLPRPGVATLPHQDEARALEMERLFRPWTRNGVPIAVIVNDYVSLLPPEAWSNTHIPFPEHWTLQEATVQLSRSRCFGSCPFYRVTVAGTGTVEYAGGSDVLIPGHHVARVSPQAVKDLIAEFAKADFLSAKDEYRAAWTDNPTYELTLAVGGHIKSVVDYVGTEDGMPLAIRNLEAAVDGVAGTARWIKGDDTTIKSLQAEHWPFAAPSKENLAVYKSAIMKANGALSGALVDQYLAVNAPFVSPDKQDASPVCVASGAGNVELVQRMVAGRPPHKPLPLPAHVVNQCMLAAARSGNLAMLDYWLEKGADPTVQPVKTEDPTSGWSVLANGILSNNPDVVKKLLEYKVDVHAPMPCGDACPVLSFTLQRGNEHSPRMAELLIAAGADVNARGQLGETPLFAANAAPAAVKYLLAAGADLEARNDNGSTALIRYGFLEPMVRVLLAAGANPTLSDNHGNTALTTANQYGCPACATLIEKALKTREAAVKPD